MHIPLVIHILASLSLSACQAATAFAEMFADKQLSMFMCAVTDQQSTGTHLRIWPSNDVM